MINTFLVTIIRPFRFFTKLQLTFPDVKDLDYFNIQVKQTKNIFGLNETKNI